MCEKYKNEKKIAAKIFKEKIKNRQYLAKLPIEEKIEILITMQKRALEIAKSAGRNTDHIHVWEL